MKSRYLILIIAVVSVASIINWFFSNNTSATTVLGTWASQNILPTGVADHTSVFVPVTGTNLSALYVIGGIIDYDNGTPANSFYWGHINDTDGSVGAMSNSSDISLTFPEGRYNQASSFYEGNGHKFIYVAGGESWDGSQTSYIDDIYRIEINSTTGDPETIDLLSTHIPTTLTDSRMIITNINSTDYMYLIGGYIDGGTYSNKIYRSAIDTNGDLATFSEINVGDISENAFGEVSLVNINSDKYIILTGGQSLDIDNNVTPSAKITSFKIDPSTATFVDKKDLGDLPYDLFGHSSAAVEISGSDIYLIGGYTEDLQDYNINIVILKNIHYDDQTSNIAIGSIDSDTLSPVTGQSLTTILGTAGSDYRLYTIGGSDSIGNLDTIYRSKVTGLNTSPSYSFSSAPTGVQHTSPITYSFTVSDVEGTVQSVEYNINGSDHILLEPVDGTYDEATEEFTLELQQDWFTHGQSESIYFYAKDNEDALSVTTYSFTFDDQPPTITFDETHTGLVPENFKFSGTIEDPDTGIYQVAYKFDEWNDGRAAYDDPTGSQHTADFEFTIHSNGDENVSAGEHTLYVYARDVLGNTQEYTFDVDIDKSVPSCTASWYNQPFPLYSSHLQYNNITCTDDRGITSASYRVYHGVFGDIYNHIALDNPIDGTWGGTTESFNISIDMPEGQDLDGGVSVEFYVKDEAGNESYDQDPVVMEYVDDNAPTLKLEPFTPNPLPDNTPVLTGSCSDDYLFDTHTNISEIKYRIDSGSWIQISPLHSQTKEVFSASLTDLDPGDYSVEVSCTDGASHTTTQTQDLSVIPIDETEQPGTFEYSEAFSSHTFQDTANSDLIWGNGQLRLKEDIQVTRTAIDISGYGSRYGSDYNNYNVVKDSLDNNILWYAKFGQVGKYNISSNTYSQLDLNALFGKSMLDPVFGFASSAYNGKSYLWLSDTYDLMVYNVTDNTGIIIHESIPVGSIYPDVQRGRFGAYLGRSGIQTPDGYVDMSYFEFTDGTISDTVFTDDFIPLSAGGFPDKGVLSMKFKPGTNTLYLGFYNVGIYLFDDNNTPTNFTDDQYASYDNIAYENVYGAYDFDPQGHLIFGTAGNSNGKLFVVTNDNSTALDTADDTIVQLSTPIKLAFGSIYGVQYISGQNNVGNQLLLKVENANPVYLNYNSTYDDLLDDTYIFLDFTNSMRGIGVYPLVYDYNTIYADIRYQGFYKITLNRGWAGSGSAVGIPERPSKKIILDNFTANANTKGVIPTITAADNSSSPNFLNNLANILAPKVHADTTDGINYYISNDDGLSWSPITLGDLEQLSPKDYRVKYKIEMSKVNNSTPVLGQYSLNFAGYATSNQPATVTGLTASALPSNVGVNNDFTLTIKAVDSLGFNVSGNSDDISISLIKVSDDSLVSNLLNKSSATLTNGKIIFSDAKISEEGIYKVRISNGIYIADSNPITVGSNQTITPTLMFYANKYKIQKGESVILSWNSTNIDNLNLSGVGNVDLNSSITLKPEKTTYYILSGTGSNGNLQAGFNIDVVDSENPVSNPISNELSLKVSDNITVNHGDKVRISWEAIGADSVFIDYLNKNVSSKGEFEFYPENDVDIKIIAKKGEDQIEKIIKITVVQSLLPISNFANSNFNFLLKLPEYNLIALLLLNLVGFIALLLNIVATGSSKLSYETIASVLKVLGIIPYKQREGYVYQTKTTKPVSLAVLNLKTSENKVLASIITDLDGAYYEPFLSKGRYTVEAKHPQNQFPTKNDRPSYFTINDYYKGEELYVPSNKDKEAIIIPMDYSDPNGSIEENDWKTKLSLYIKRLLVWLQWTVYPMFVLSIIYILTDFNIINLVVFLTYLAIILLKLYKYLRIPTLQGTIVDKITGSGISNAFVILKTPTGEVVGIDKTNNRGHYKFYVPKGKYNVYTRVENYVSDNTFGSVLTIDLNTLESNKFNIKLNRV